MAYSNEVSRKTFYIFSKATLGLTKNFTVFAIYYGIAAVTSKQGQGIKRRLTVGAMRRPIFPMCSCTSKSLMRFEGSAGRSEGRTIMIHSDLKF